MRLGERQFFRCLKLLTDVTQKDKNLYYVAPPGLEH